MKNFLCILLVGGLLAASLHSAMGGTKEKTKKKRNVTTVLRVLDEETIVGSVRFRATSGGKLEVDVVVASGAPAERFSVAFSYTVVGGPQSTISRLGHLETDQDGNGNGHYEVDLSSIAGLRIMPWVHLITSDRRYRNDEVVVELKQ